MLKAKRVLESEKEWNRVTPMIYPSTRTMRKFKEFEKKKDISPQGSFNARTNPKLDRAGIIRL